MASWIRTYVRAIAALGVTLVGCSNDPDPEGHECGDFTTSARDGMISSTPDGVVFARAAVVTARAADDLVADVSSACRAIAADLGALGQTSAENNTPSRALMGRWCTLAQSKISERRGSNLLRAAYDPVVCRASIAAYTTCRASCRPSGACDVRKTPPRCDGGKMRANCIGHCTAGGGPVECTGLCVGTCKGSCTAATPIDCAGTCLGTCAPPGPGAACNGKCTGTCSAARSGSCPGTCEGTCLGSCDARGNLPAQCDGACDGPSEPVECRGGALAGGCEVSEECGLGCELTSKAAVVCGRPLVGVTSTSDRAEDEVLVVTLQKNLPVLLEARARARALGEPARPYGDQLQRSFTFRSLCAPYAASTISGANEDLEAVRSTVDRFAGVVDGVER